VSPRQRGARSLRHWGSLSRSKQGLTLGGVVYTSIPMAKKAQMVVYPIRLPFKTARRMRALAKIREITPSEFGRDLISAVIGGNQRETLEFLGALSEAMQRYDTKPVVVSGDDAGLFTAPSRK
jgi:hypothetical protein